MKAALDFAPLIRATPASLFLGGIRYRLPDAKTRAATSYTSFGAFPFRPKARRPTPIGIFEIDPQREDDRGGAEDDRHDVTAPKSWSSRLHRLALREGPGELGRSNS